FAPRFWIEIISAGEDDAVDHVHVLRDQRKIRAIRQHQRQSACLLDGGAVGVGRLVASEVVVVIDGNTDDGSGHDADNNPAAINLPAHLNPSIGSRVNGIAMNRLLKACLLLWLLGIALSIGIAMALAIWAQPGSAATEEMRAVEGEEVQA